MNTKSLQQIIDTLKPAEALKEMAAAIKTLFPLLEEKARLDFVMDLVGDSGQDKVSSLVHL